jgi:hypothetical protein
MVAGPTPGRNPGRHASTGCWDASREVRWVREVEGEGTGREWGAGQEEGAHVHLQDYRGAIVYKAQVEFAKVDGTNLEIPLAVG